MKRIQLSERGRDSGWGFLCRRNFPFPILSDFKMIFHRFLGITELIVRMETRFFVFSAILSTFGEEFRLFPQSQVLLEANFDFSSISRLFKSKFCPFPAFL